MKRRALLTALAFLGLVALRVAWLGQSWAIWWHQLGNGALLLFALFMGFVGGFIPAWRAVLDYPMAERLALTQQPCRIIGADQDVFAPCLAHARGLRPSKPG